MDNNPNYIEQEWLLFLQNNPSAAALTDEPKSRLRWMFFLGAASFLNEAANPDFDATRMDFICDELFGFLRDLSEVTNQNEVSQ